MPTSRRRTAFLSTGISGMIPPMSMHDNSSGRSGAKRRHSDLPDGRAGQGIVCSIGVETLKEIDEFVYIMDDTPEFISGGLPLLPTVQRQGSFLPSLVNWCVFRGTTSTSWHTPGHAGGTAFRKSPAGRLFFKFFGEQLFSDQTYPSR